MIDIGENIVMIGVWCFSGVLPVFSGVEDDIGESIVMIGDWCFDWSVIGNNKWH